MNHGAHCKKHDHCDHCLHYCGTCDKPYCCKCGREWPSHQAHPYWWTYAIPCETGATYTWDGTTTGATIGKTDLVGTMADETKVCKHGYVHHVKGEPND